MAITYEGEGTVTQNGTASTTCVVAYPAGIQAGDVVALFVGTGSATLPTNPSGSGFSTGVSGQSGGSSPAFRISYKVCDGSESGTVSVTTPNAQNQGQMHLFRGVDGTTPIDVTGTTFGSSTGTTAYNIPTLTTTTTGVALFYYGVANTTSGTWTPPTNPAAFTEVHDSGTSAPGCGAGYLIWSGSGATGTVDLVRSTSIRGAAGMIALRPAASGTPGTITTTAGAATAAGGSSTFTAGAVIASSAGSATAAGGSTTFRVAVTVTTTAGTATAAGGSSTFSGSAAATITTVAGGATGAGGSSTLTAGAVLGTTAGAATAAGGSGTFTAGGTLSSSAGAATAAGGSSTFAGGSASTISTTPGSATAAGGVSTWTVPATISTLAAQATAEGQTGLFAAGAVLATTVGGALAAGGLSTLVAGDIVTFALRATVNAPRWTAEPTTARHTCVADPARHTASANDPAIISEDA